ncbi:hypothetical protein QYE76_010750 [Lolium multiflorum]|uniref:Uncharacterized protein n=1 Tax=Lolium multiflorum TaxID=4521 RepID=A0AAD8X274_LOLMU|nr:hypothetical protein QYE76_010750 [Lolium multiflorum]
MASSAAEPPPPPPPPPGGGEGSASTRSRSTPVAVEFVYPSGVPPLPVSRGEDWESEGSNAWIPSGIDPALAFRLVVRLDSSFTRDSKRNINGFNFPAVVATTISLRDLKANICDKYPWSPREAVHSEYFNSTERRFVPLISDDDLGILFALNASCRFGKIRIHVDRGQTSSGVGASSGGRASCLSTAAASANSVRRGAPCRSTAAPSVPSASGSQIVPVVNVEDDAEIGDQSPEDDEDELMFPELVDRCSKQAMEDQYMEDIAFGARFDETDDEEKNENDDSLVLADYEGEDLPTIEWNREDPQLAKGTVFQTMMDCRNAITTYHILTKNNYEVIKSEPAFGMEDQAGAANAEENEAAIQLEEIEAAVQHEEIEAAVQHEEIEAAVQHEEIEAAIEHEEIEPMDREQREQMDVEWLRPMSPEEKEQYDRDCYDSTFAQIAANFEEHIQEEKAQASQKKKNKKEGKRKVDTGNIPGRVTRNPLLMKDTKTAAVPTVVIDATNIEAIAYNIASTAQIQHSMSEPVDVSLPLPSSDPLLMKDTKTPAVPRVRIDAKTIEAIVYNRAAKPPIQPSADPSLMKYTKTAAVPTLVIDATNIEAIAYNIASTADGADDHPSAARRPGLSCPSVRGRVRRRKLG